MINQVSRSHANSTNQTSQLAARQPQAQPQLGNALPKDTVQLKSTGDVNHDGDKK
jgi:hypothetical protein